MRCQPSLTTCITGRHPHSHTHMIMRHVFQKYFFFFFSDHSQLDVMIFSGPCLLICGYDSGRKKNPCEAAAGTHLAMDCHPRCLVWVARKVVQVLSPKSKHKLDENGILFCMKNAKWKHRFAYRPSTQTYTRTSSDSIRDQNIEKNFVRRVFSWLCVWKIFYDSIFRYKFSSIKKGSHARQRHDVIEVCSLHRLAHILPHSKNIFWISSHTLGSCVLLPRLCLCLCLSRSSFSNFFFSF